MQHVEPVGFGCSAKATLKKNKHQDNTPATIAMNVSPG